MSDNRKGTRSGDRPGAAAPGSWVSYLKLTRVPHCERCLMSARRPRRVSFHIPPKWSSMTVVTRRVAGLQLSLRLADAFAGAIFSETCCTVPFLCHRQATTKLSRRRRLRNASTSGGKSQDYVDFSSTFAAWSVLPMNLPGSRNARTFLAALSISCNAFQRGIKAAVCSQSFRQRRYHEIPQSVAR